MSKSDNPTPVTATTPLKAGDEVLVDYYGSWWEGEIVELVDEENVLTHYKGYDSSWDEEVPRSRLALAPSAPAGPTEELPLTVGSVVQVEWHGSWFPADVLALEGNKVRIHYQGWGSNWDEAVPRSRIRLGTAGATGMAMAVAAGGETPVAPVSFGQPPKGSKPLRSSTALKAGDRFLCEWHGGWWPCEVAAVQAEDRIRVHFPGWGTQWDEVVPRSRLRVEGMGAWEALEGKQVIAHLNAGIDLEGTVVESSDEYLVLQRGDKHLLIPTARLVYCEFDG